MSGAMNICASEAAARMRRWIPAENAPFHLTGIGIIQTKTVVRVMTDGTAAQYGELRRKRNPISRSRSISSAIELPAVVR